MMILWQEGLNYLYLTQRELQSVFFYIYPLIWIQQSHDIQDSFSISITFPFTSTWNAAKMIAHNSDLTHKTRRLDYTPMLLVTSSFTHVLPSGCRLSILTYNIIQSVTPPLMIRGTNSFVRLSYIICGLITTLATPGTVKRKRNRGENIRKQK